MKIHSKSLRYLQTELVTFKGFPRLVESTHPVFRPFLLLSKTERGRDLLVTRGVRGVSGLCRFR